MDLSSKKCIPCEGGASRLDEKKIETFKKLIQKDWIVVGNIKITKEFAFVNFLHTMNFVNKVAVLAEEEGHHPDLHVSYAKVVIELWTHAVNGLTENDFILASKIDKI